MTSPTGPRRGVLLVNLGTPDAPTPAAVRRYLREFLGDRHVVDMPRALWWPILEGFVLPLRPRRSARLYASIWGPDGSPLACHTRALTAEVATRLPGDVLVGHAMRYGRPSLAEGLADLRRRGAGDAVVLPLFPQYSTSTTASVVDRLATLDAGIDVTVAPAFGEDGGYLAEVAGRVQAAWARWGRPDFAAGDRLVLSFHGIPESMVRKGDPYVDQCHATARGLRAALGVTQGECLTTFQSRFGPAPWVGPATLATMRSLGAAGTGRVDVVCPGFAADCLETVEEIDRLNREAFEAAGGGTLHYIPCANASPAWADVVTDLVVRAMTPVGQAEPVPPRTAP